jgi:hypothetical protein
MRRENVIFVIIFLNVQHLVLAIKFKVALQSRTSVLGCTKKIVSQETKIHSSFDNRKV